MTEKFLRLLLVSGMLIISGIFSVATIIILEIEPTPIGFFVIYNFYYIIIALYTTYKAK